MFLVHKYTEYRAAQAQHAKKKVTEKELFHLNTKIEKLLSKLDEHELEMARNEDEECVVCITAKANMTTYPCAHSVLCRKCFVKTIQMAVTERRLPLRCVICRAKILRLKQGNVPVSDSLYSVSSNASSTSAMSWKSGASTTGSVISTSSVTSGKSGSTSASSVISGRSSSTRDSPVGKGKHSSSSRQFSGFSGKTIWIRDSSIVSAEYTSSRSVSASSRTSRCGTSPAPSSSKNQPSSSRSVFDFKNSASASKTYSVSKSSLDLKTSNSASTTPKSEPFSSSTFRRVQMARLGYEPLRSTSPPPSPPRSKSKPGGKHKVGQEQMEPQKPPPQPLSPAKGKVKLSQDFQRQFRHGMFEATTHPAHGVANTGRVRSSRGLGPEVAWTERCPMKGQGQLAQGQQPHSGDSAQEKKVNQSAPVKGPRVSKV